MDDQVQKYLAQLIGRGLHDERARRKIERHFDLAVAYLLIGQGQHAIDDGVDIGGRLLVV